MHDVSPPDGSPRSRIRRRAALSTALAAILALAIAGILSRPDGTPPASPEPARQAALATPAEEDPTPEPAHSVGPEAIAAWRSALLDSVAITKFAPPTPALDALAPSGESAPDAAPEAQSESQTAEPQTAEALPLRTVPLPVPRPPELRRPADPTRAARAAARRNQAAAVAAPMEDTRNFFEKLLGVGQPQSAPQTPALAYAALETPPADANAASPRRLLAPTPAPPAAPSSPDLSGGGIAVYDISARTVTLPNGEKLEAHSGLGETMDDPRYVHMRMRGSTPPGTYDLTEREALFHGVRAIRLHPVGGPEAIHGRAGLLAHTYMLGPSGASNGCISFRHYDRFLQAYLRGEVRRVVVVPGRKLDGLPSFAEKLFGKPVRSASAE